MSTRTTLLSLAAVLLAALVFGGAPPARAQEESELPSAVAPTIPREARERTNPVAPTEDSLERGGMLFTSQCTMCHGTAGDGQGSLVARLKLEMPDFTDPQQQAGRTDGELFYILSKGHGRMPGQGERFMDQTKWDLVNYVRQFRPEK